MDTDKIQNKISVSIRVYLWTNNVIFNSKRYFASRKMLKISFPALLFFQFLLLHSAFAQDLKPTRTQTLLLGETEVRVNIYEKRGARVTFVVPHHNEQTGLQLTKEIIREKGGRLVELVVLNDKGAPTRYLKFNFKGAEYRIDPNRIFTANGRSTKCSLVPEDYLPPIQAFAENLLKILLPPNGKRFRRGERVLVAVHNNSDVDEAREDRRNADLTALAFIKGGRPQHPLAGEFHPQTEGVYISNDEPDEDNFFFTSTPRFMSFLSGEGYNVALQKRREKLFDADCRVDDGSLSVYAGQNNIPYINIEADQKNGRERQKQMLATVYKLIGKSR